MSERKSVAVERVDDIALVRLQRGKGNSLSPAFVEELLEALRDPDVVEKSKALVLTGEGRFFSTGLDLPELTRLDRAGMLLFLDRLQGLLAALWVWSRPVIAAVNGHAVAGGCLLALCADWRVMARGEGRIGLTEMTLGLPLPQAGLEITRAQLPPHAFAAVAYDGMTHQPDEAAKLGLVDELADPERVVEAALERARAWSRHPSVAFHHTKAAIRDPVLLRIRDRHDQHEEEWVDLWFSPPAQERIAQICEKLAAKKSV